MNNDKKSRLTLVLTELKLKENTEDDPWKL